jgi:hypothetical protein
MYNLSPEAIPLVSYHGDLWRSLACDSGRRVSSTDVFDDGPAPVVDQRSGRQVVSVKQTHHVVIERIVIVR